MTPQLKETGNRKRVRVTEITYTGSTIATIEFWHSAKGCASDYASRMRERYAQKAKVMYPDNRVILLGPKGCSCYVIEEI